ncbi:F-box protein CPR1-like [Cornus florida]|uniref:F-box protein CPR1-like n=1 Tax=Cornus florida TaxID=4283 RepID=UPI00289946CF|nr:F-box protein CPR1-like [Cornus florida]
MLELDHPLKNDGGETEVIGSCDDLLCLFNLHQNHKKVALWNPSTRKHHKLPANPIAFPDIGRNRLTIAYGFGYDRVSDDYKVVRMIESLREDLDSFDCEVLVYNLKLNSWRRIQDFPYYHRYSGYGMLANGALHWVVFPTPGLDRPELIAAFDLGVEEHRLVPQPDYPGKNFDLNVEILGGWLCVICDYCRFGADTCVDIWVMKEFGGKESWTRLFSVAQPSSIREFKYVWTLVFSQSRGEVLLIQDGGRLLWYDFKMNTIKYTEIRGGGMETNVCFGSHTPL